MKCSILGCPGEYEEKTIVHTVRRKGQVFVIDHVPAEVCSICGDMLLAPNTIRHIEHILKVEALLKPQKMIPLYKYA